MPQLTSIVLKDNADADQTFTPKGIVSGVSTLVRSNGVPVGDFKLTLAHSKTQTGREKITVKLAVPVVQDVTVGGISRPTPVRSGFVDITFTVDQTSNTAERADLLAMAASLLNHAVMEDLVVDLEDLY